MVMVLIENDAYYIPEKKLNKILNTDKFYFKYTRKDLIAVNNIIHADLLWKKNDSNIPELTTVYVKKD